MILELECDKTRKGAAHKCLAEKVIGWSIEMWFITTEAVLNVRILDEIMDAEEIVTAYDNNAKCMNRCGLSSASCVIRQYLTRKPLDGLSVHEPAEAYFRCLEKKDTSRGVVKTGLRTKG